ncbi:MAG: pyrroline-5-carboxylate reductase [Microlunatus sp.]
MSQILLIGAGNMGFSMLQSWTKLEDQAITVIERSDPLRQRAATIGAQAYLAPDDLPPNFIADVIVVATKPQAVGDVVTSIRHLLRRRTLLVSIAAGVTLGSLRKFAGEGPAVVRCMPNTPSAVGEGMIVCCANTNTSSVDRDRAKALLSAVGKVAFIEDEGLMDAVTAVSGSGPAYIFHFLEALSAAGVSVGLPPKLSMTLAKQTVLGAAKMACSPDADPAILREQVTSPNGTTAAALDILMSDKENMTVLLQRAVTAAERRARELGGS